MNYFLKIVVFLFIGFLLFKTKNFYSNIQLSDKYFIIFDNLLSEKYVQIISNYINQNLINIKPKEFVLNIQEKFPFIKQIIIKRENPNFLTATIKIFEPVLKINEEKVFANNGKIFDKEIYNLRLSEDLVNIQIDNFDQELILKELSKFIFNLPEFIIQDFVIEWVNKHKILLKSKNDNNLFLFVKFDKIPCNKLIEQCRAIYYEYLSNLKQKNKKEIYCDLRFFDQIIFSAN